MVCRDPGRAVRFPVQRKGLFSGREASCRQGHAGFDVFMRFWDLTVPFSKNSMVQILFLEAAQFFFEADKNIGVRLKQQKEACVFMQALDIPRKGAIFEKKKR